MGTSWKRTLGTLMSWGLSASVWAAEPLDEAQRQVRDEEVRATLKSESEALTTMLEVLKAEVRGGNIQISDAAKVSWQRGAREFGELVSGLESGETANVLRATGPVRALLQEGSQQAFSVRLSVPIRKALRSCVDAVAPRLESLRRVVEARHDEALDQRWRGIKAAFERAKTLAATDDYGNAWASLTSAADQLDLLALDIVYESAPIASVEEPSASN